MKILQRCRSCLVLLLGSLLAVVTSTQSLATVRETLTFNPVNSNGVLNSPANAIQTSTLAGGYALGRIDLSGTLTSSNANTFASDAQVLITAPNGATFTFHPFDGIGLFSTQPFTRSIFIPGVSSTAGNWTFRFFEVVDNGGTAQVDASWNITIRYTDEPPASPVGTNLGTVTTPGASVPTFQSSSTGYVWYQFTLTRAVLPALGRYLDISVASSDPSPDTEIALFSSAGALVASDDDSGPGLLSQLSFGEGTRPPIGDGLPFDGRNGGLSTGTYYLAVGKYHLQVQPSLPWGLTFQGSGTMNASFQIITNLAPGTDCFAPTVTQQPQSVLVSPGQVVHFTSASTGAGTLTYHWRHLSVNLTDDAVVSGSTTPTLTISGVRASDAGSYDVIITNNCGTTTSNTANLGVACSADFNGDSDTGTDADIEAFFACLAGNCCATCGSADFNGDGDVGTDADIEAFFRVLGGGPC